MTAKLILAYLLQSADISGVTIDTSNLDPQEVYCLAENIYYEAKSEDIKGQFAVASVTLNRVNNPRFPSSVCDVVQQSVRMRSTNKTVCAFSWYCENNKRGKEIPVSNKNGSINRAVADQFRRASVVAITVLSGNAKDNTNGATHFHNPNTSNPTWASVMRKTVSIGNHNFYK